VKPSLLASLALLAAAIPAGADEIVTAPLVGDGHLQCFVEEMAGRRTEKYAVRLSIPTKSAGEFPLKLVPLMLVHVESWVDKVPGRPLQINVTLIDNSVEEADLLWDLVLARAKGETLVSLYAKLGPTRRHAVRVECSREEAVERKPEDPPKAVLPSL
jgi:hypothetical protein